MLSLLARGSLVATLMFLLTACGSPPAGGDGGPGDSGDGPGTDLDGTEPPGDGGPDGRADRAPDLEPDAAEEPHCGDGLLNQPNEQCDDGNNEPGDGCSATCRLEANYRCPTPGMPCISTVVCGDGVIGGNEQCDDGNAGAGDGCSDSCQLEPGWICPGAGRPCRAAECGDGLVAGREECDIGTATPTDGCVDCRLVPGFACPTPGQPCVATTCGDGVAEGTEQCDDGNNDLGDGCSPLCGSEPDCSQGACISRCGDGILLGDEECDDGNNRDGDGCSADCRIEEGFYCSQPPLASSLTIPLVVRDFQAGARPTINAGPPMDYASPSHVDFQPEPGGTENGAGTNLRIVRSGQTPSATGRGLDLGGPGETFALQNLDGTALATVSLSGKPVFSMTRAQCDKTVIPPSPAAVADKCTRTVMDADSFHTWYIDRDVNGDEVTWPNYLGRGPTAVTTLTLLQGNFTGDPVNGFAFNPGGTAYTYNSRFMAIDGTIPAVVPADLDGGYGFYPVDQFGSSGTGGNDGLPHNFHFTSEVRFWFQYDAAAQPRLDFSGDDDVWVFVNGHLALDLGGVHGRLADNFVVDAGNAALWGLEDGKVYEIAVFQAERHTTRSNYLLTLNGFNTQRSTCQSECGDGILASDELCDDGEDNHSGPDPIPYGRCGADCQSRGAFCGDGTRQEPEEECDDGANISTYDFDGNGCAPGCKKPPRCGDALIQAPFEECDDGTNDGGYNGCNSDCTLGPRCGDRQLQTASGEECDDGPNGSATCSPSCKLRRPQG